MPVIPPQAHPKAALPEEENLARATIPERPRRIGIVARVEQRQTVLDLTIQVLGPGGVVLAERAKTLPASVLGKPNQAGLVDVDTAIEEVLCEYHCEQQAQSLMGHGRAF